MAGAPNTTAWASSIELMKILFWLVHDTISDEPQKISEEEKKLWSLANAFFPYLFEKQGSPRTP